MSKLAVIKDIVIEILNDYKEHSAQEMREEIYRRGVSLDEGGSAFRTAIYQLKNNGLNIVSRERGVYCLVKQKEMLQLNGFSVLKPIDKISKRCVYIHEDGKIILNGRLNGEVASRKLEIRIADGGERLALIEEGEVCHRFTKNGIARNAEVIKIFGKKKIKFPICFEMEQYEGIWMGKIKKVKTSNK